MMMFLNRKQLGGASLLVLAAATVATLCDKVHVMTRTLVYPEPNIGGQGWWVFPCFILAFVAMVIGYLALDCYLPETIDRKNSREKGEASALIDSFLLFVMVYLLSGFGSDDPMVLNLLFYGAFLIRFALAKDRLFLAILSLLLAFFGVFAEGGLAMMGLMAYSRPDFFHVPGWLAGLYLHGAFALREGMRVFVFNEFA